MLYSGIQISWTYHDKVNQRHGIERDIPYVHETQQVDNNDSHCEGHDNSYTQVKSHKNKSDNKDGSWNNKENCVRNFNGTSRNFFDTYMYILHLTKENKANSQTSPKQPSKMPRLVGHSPELLPYWVKILPH